MQEEVLTTSDVQGEAPRKIFPSRPRAGVSRAQVNVSKGTLEERCFRKGFPKALPAAVILR